MKTKQIIILFLLSLVFAHVANLGGYFLNWHWQLSIAGLMYFFVPFFYLRNEKNRKRQFVKALVILLGFYLQLIAAWIIEGKPDFPQVTPIVLTPFLAIIFALWMVSIKQKAKRITLAVVVSGFFVVAGLIGMPNWLNYVYSPEANIQRDFPPVKFITQNKSELNSSIFKGRVSVIDFYGTYCSVCFKQMPAFNELAKEYANNQSIRFYSIHLPTKHDSLENSLNLLEPYNYEFIHLFCTDISAQKTLGIQAVPNYMILNKNGEIIYKGTLNTEWYEFIHPTRKIIDIALGEMHYIGI